MRVVFMVFLSALILLPRTAQAQDSDEDMCAQLILQTLSDLGTNCANMESNTACYGFEQVTAAFTEAMPEDHFSKAGDRTELISLVTLTTAKMDVQESIWGIGVLHVRANIHNALEPEAVFIAAGDVTLENAVEPETALLPVQPITINTITKANLYRSPDVNADVLGTVEAGIPLQVDGLRTDGLWLRALYHDGKKNYAAWVGAGLLDAAVDTSGLPLISDETYTPYQEFFLRNSFDRPECANALPPLLLVQGPKDTEVDVVVNGTHIRVGSTIIVQVISDNMMRVMTLYGMATINPDTPNELLVPPGFSTTTCLSEPDDYGGLDREDNDQINACPWSEIAMLTNDDMSGLTFINELPDNILEYVISLPTVIQPSGIGSAFPVLFFTDPDALEAAQQACADGLLPDFVCSRLFY